MSEPISVSARDAAELLGVSERTVATYTAKGDIPHFRIGNRVLYSIDVLREWVRERCLTQRSVPEDHAGEEQEAA